MRRRDSKAAAKRRVSIKKSAPVVAGRLRPQSRLSEDDALNLICNARLGEPTHPIKKLFKKFGYEGGD